MNSKRMKQLIQNNLKRDGDYILYWMQASQRIQYNHALAHAIDIANEEAKGVVVLFTLMDDYPYANARHYTFMLEGLQEVKQELEKRNIPFIIKQGKPIAQVMSLAKKAHSIVFDVGYLRHQRYWRNTLYKQLKHYPINLYKVESDLVVPIKQASEKLEYAARTIRKKLMKQYQSYLEEPTLDDVMHPYKSNITSDVTLDDIDSLVASMAFSKSPKKSPIYTGGYHEANTLFEHFLEDYLNDYANSSDPSKQATSHMSMYLHFGQISPVELINRVFNFRDMNPSISQEHIDGFIEQLLVRRELAFNFCYYEPKYDEFEHITYEWAYQTMHLHEGDKREYLYTKEDYIACNTHDKYFNAAMKEMVYTGFMHNYMRMYWAKKIIEWSKNYKEAFETIRYLNDTFFIDGRDPNSYTGIAWCFGRHDRAWTEREIFGKLRYMNANGLKRKFNIEDYVTQMNSFKKNTTF